MLNDALSVRVDEKTALELLDRYDFVRPFDITDRILKERAMKGLAEHLFPKIS